MPSKERNGAIDLLKFVFALQILLHHARQLISEWTLFEGCYIGVSFFFLVSGLYMARSAAGLGREKGVSLGTDTRRFMAGRIKRLLPCYLIAFAVCFFVRWIINPVSVKSFFSNVALSVYGFGLLEMAGFDTVVSVPTAWYLSAMLISMLVLYPLLRRDQDTFTSIIAPLAFILIMGYLSKSFHSLGNPTQGTPLVYKGLLEGLATISLGTVCYRVAESGAWRISKRCSLLIQLVGYLAVLLASVWVGKTNLDFVLVLILALCVTLSYRDGSGLLPGSRLTAYLGRLSYPLFLMHMPVLEAIRACLGIRGNALRFSLYAAISLLAAAICLYAGERLQTMMQRKNPRQAD